MGGQNSKPIEEQNKNQIEEQIKNPIENNNDFKLDEFYNKIDDIATNYILTMDFKSLKKISEKEYCDKLVLMTSEIFENNLNNMEVKYLLQRTQFGANENPNAEYLNEMKHKKFFFYMNNKTKKFDKFDVALNGNEMKESEKNRVCIGIAKFYIIIAHLFASIVKTINPVYSYSDANGDQVEIDFFNKDRIPPNVKTQVKKISICDNRLRALKENIQADENNDIYFKANNCDINIEKETLNNEPGIYEFQNLYMDDNYDYLTGNFTSKSESSTEIFKEDLKRFYTEFSGETNMPSDITKFSDIKLQYFNKEDCINKEEPIYENNENADLFRLYAQNIRTMMKNTSEGQERLLEILNLIFIPKDNEKFIISPELNEELLYALVGETRKIIMNLYLTCERDYLNGIKIYKQLVNQIEYKNTERQIKNLENQQKKLVCEYVPISEDKEETNETEASDYDKDEYEDEDEYEEQMLIQLDDKKDEIYKQ
jgi:hypothetical protein